MKIINLQAENYKRIRAIDITPDGSMVLLTGANAQGKSSVLDAIWAVLEGGAASRVTERPIRKGEQRARVRLDLGEYIVTRIWTKDDSGTLTVESPRGAKYGSPQKLLDELVGKLSMDPLAFVKMKGSDQVAALVSVLGDSLGFDPAELEARRKRTFEERTAVNRQVKELRVRLEALPEVPDDTPDETLALTDLTGEYSVAVQHNHVVGNAKSDVESYAIELEQAEAAIAKAIEHRDTVAKELAAAKLVVEGLGSEIDTDEINERIAQIEQINDQVRAKNNRLNVADLLADAADVAAELDEKLDAIATEKAEALAAAKFPVDGLSFDETGVTYNGIPLEQASGAEKLRVSFGVAIAQNPELRVIRIDEGESLDSAGLKQIAELAEAHDMQVWVSKVDESGKVGIVIEDGMVAA